MLKLIREYKELRHLAYHDSLTGLLNRNWLYKNINNINKLYVYFIDINNLREYNKQGHTNGDNHIKKIVSLLPNRKDDILIRYAGDEFILISDMSNYISTNHLYSVGKCNHIKGDLLKSINIADSKMIINKAELK